MDIWTKQDPPGLEIIEKNLVHKGSILDMFSLKVKVPDGNIQTWDLVEHRMGAACVLPVTKDGKLVMVRQYRPALGRYTWEVPAGSRDARDEDPALCAKRELEEETGYRSDPLEFLLELRTTVAFCNEAISVYLARNAEKTGHRHLDEAEEIDVRLFTLDELLEEIYAGRIQDGKTVSAVLAYASKLFSGKL